MLNQKEKVLHEKFQQLGKSRREVTYKLLEILPEIYERRIYRKLKFNSIYQYAAEIAGFEFNVVNKCLDLEEKLKDKPLLKEAIGKVGVHKVALVSNVATLETEEFWADKAENSSKSTLVSLAKEERAFQKENGQSLYGTENAEKFECRAADEKVRIELDKEMQILFFALKKEVGAELSNKEALRKILKKCPRKITENCSYRNCAKPVDEVHHSERFAIVKNHEKLVGLCKVHHEYMHNGLVKNETEETWRYSSAIKPSIAVDLKYRKYKKPPD